ncbi:hypothetical protein TIFTF001_013089 [Ficus carica]|uniref:Uncharacterized protein n=1 Tax=Ficus carica TaxID=3494 RepID=A0AA88AH63_FICCA|nr:hypothetical protein TIFTF001_013089 [Ficus carica]
MEQGRDGGHGGRLRGGGRRLGVKGRVMVGLRGLNHGGRGCGRGHGKMTPEFIDMFNLPHVEAFIENTWSDKPWTLKPFSSLGYGTRACRRMTSWRREMTERKRRALPQRTREVVDIFNLPRVEAFIENSENKGKWWNGEGLAAEDEGEEAVVMLLAMPVFVAVFLVVAAAVEK